MADDHGRSGNLLPHESLSERELQVFLVPAKGESVSSIAESLNLSVKTVSTYRSRCREDRREQQRRVWLPTPYATG